jgi:hypothetical protein
MAESNQTEHKHFREFIPEEAVEHAKAARAEMRKSFAAREIINHALERIETHEDNID